MDRIVGAARGEAKHVFLLLSSWGLRISELAMLEWTDIDAVGRWVNIQNKVNHDGVKYRPKDKTDRKFPLEGEPVLAALNVLAERTGRQGYVLPLERVKSHPDVAERRVIGDLKELSVAVGIPKKRLTLHRFHDFFVSECADHGVPMATVMKWVGHDEMKMVMHYYSLRDDTAREAMRRLTSEPSASAPPPTAAAEPTSPTQAATEVPPAAPKTDSREKPHPPRGKTGRSGKDDTLPAAQDHTRETTWIICGSTSKKTRSRAGNGVERRGGDSNPRCSYPHTRFPSVPDRPLRHLSNQGVMLCRPQRSAPIHYYRASLQPRKRGRRPKREDVGQRLRAAGHAGTFTEQLYPILDAVGHGP